MAIISRVSRLLAADLHAVIDRLEEPQAQLQQAIREMQQLTAALQVEQQQAQAALDNLHEQRQALIQQQHTTSEELELCLDAGEDQLARAVVKRSLQQEKLLAQIDKDLKLSQAQQAARVDLLAEHQNQLDELKAQAQLVQSSLGDAAGEKDRSTRHSDTGITEAQIDIALLAHQQRRAQS